MQVIITTHSSTVVKELTFDDLRLITFDDTGQKIVENVQPGQMCYPSLNEINYVAFEAITIEYFNELYGYMVYQQWMDEYNQQNTKRTYIKPGRNGNIQQQVTSAEYIRHQIHHPENHNNTLYTQNELRTAIESLRAFIQGKAV